MTLLVEKIIQEISSVYDDVLESYVSKIDTNQKPPQIGGSYYGSTELISTVGTHFNKTVGYQHHGGYYELPSYYDFAFKIGGSHMKDFSPIKKIFFNDFNVKLQNVLKQNDFEQNKRTIGAEEYRILSREDVTYGTNFSIYCGIQIEIKKDKDINVYRLNKKWLQSILQT